MLKKLNTFFDCTLFGFRPLSWGLHPQLAILAVFGSISLGFQASALPGAYLHGSKHVIRVHSALGLLQYVLQACDQDPRCLDGEDRKILQQIRTQFPASYPADPLQFRRPADEPDLFHVGSGPHRLMVTGSTPGPIYVNSDLLASDPKMTEPGFLIENLAHELGHHTGRSDTAEARLEKFGQKVKDYYRLRSYTYQMPHSDLEVWMLQSQTAAEGLKPGTASTPLLLLLDAENVYLSHLEMYSHLSCYFGFFFPRRVMVDELHIEKGRDHRSRLIGKIRHDCEEGADYDHITRNIEMESTLSFDLIPAAPAVNGRFQLWDDRTALRVLVGWNVIESDTSLTGAALTHTKKEPSPRITDFQVKARPTPLKGWAYTAEMTSELPLTSENECRLILTSKDFALTYPSGQPYGLTKYGSCRLKKKSRGQYRMTGDFDLPENAPRRLYRVAGFHIFQDFLTSFDAFLPKSFETLAGAENIQPLTVNNVAVTRKKESRRPGDPNWLHVPWCKRFDIQVSLKDKVSALNQAHFSMRLHYRKDPKTGQTRDPLDFTFRLTDEWANKFWSTSVSEVPDGTLIRFSTYHLMDQYDPFQFDRMEFLDLQIMTHDLREVQIPFAPGEFGIVVDQNFKRDCDTSPHPDESEDP